MLVNNSEISALASANLPPNVRQLSFVGGIFSSLLIFYFVIYLFGRFPGSPFQTLSSSYIAGMCGLVFIYLFDVKKNVISARLAFFGLFIFTIRVIIGVAHYHYSMDATYFQSDMPTFSYEYDFEWMLNWMTELADLWKEDWFGKLPVRWFIEKNTWMMPYQALIFYFGEHRHFLNIVVVNSLHVMLVATLVSRLAYRLGGKAHAKVVFFIAALQPFNIFSWTLARDSVGQFFLIAGFLVILNQSLSKKGYIFMIFGILQIMMIRQVYFIVGLITISLKLFFADKNRRSINKVYVILIVFVILILSYVFLWPTFIRFYNFSESGSAKALNIMQSPLGLLRAIVVSMTGPFPWTNMFDPTITARELILPAILMAIYNISILFFFFTGVINKKIRLFSAPNIYVLAFVFSLMSMGILSLGHIAYVTIASVLLLALIPRLNPLHFILTYMIILYVDFGAAFLW